MPVRIEEPCLREHYTMEPLPFKWTDFSSHNLAVSQCCDDDYFTISLPWTLSFFCSNVTLLYVNSNGLITMDPMSGRLTATSDPYPFRNAIRFARVATPLISTRSLITPYWPMSAIICT